LKPRIPGESEMQDKPTRVLACGLAAALVLGGCGKQDDAITKAAKKDAAAGIPAPGIAEVKAIAERASSTACRS
jgi:hypothetical protein